VRSSQLLRRARVVITSLGPGVISGASDNDPTTVATLAIVGASTTYGLAWLVLLVIPMLAVVQTVAARLGAVSKRGLENAIRARYGRPLALLALFAVLAVSLLTLAADLEGGGAALQVMTGIDYRWFVVPLALITAAALVFAHYDAIARVLKYLASSSSPTSSQRFLPTPTGSTCCAVPSFHTSNCVRRMFRARSPCSVRR